MHIIESILMRIRKPHAYHPTTGEKLLRPNKNSPCRYELDIRNPNSKYWYRYMGANSPNHLDEHVATVLSLHGMYRIVEVRTGKIVQTNE